jgi:hypothetical protein
MRGGEQEAISPELVLVMPPDELRTALEALPEVVLYDPGAARRAAVAEAERAGAAQRAAEAARPAEAEREAEAETERVASAVVERVVAEARRVAAEEAGRVAAAEAGRVAVSEARRVAVAEVERAAEAERVAGVQRAEAEVERVLEAERVAEAKRAEAEFERASEAEGVDEAKRADAETEPAFELVESSIRPSATSPLAQPPNPDEEWSYPSRRPTLRSSLLALALGAVAFGCGMLVQKTFVSDQTTSLARMGAPDILASAALPSPTTSAAGHSSKLRPSPRPGTNARTRAPSSTRSKRGKAVASGFVPARVWAWSPRPGARSYLVRFFLNNRQVFSGRTHKTQLVLPHGFRYHAGRYRWLVTATPHLAQPIVDGTFVLSARSAGAANR